MSLRSLLSTGTRVWLDSIDPDHVRRNRSLGITGATSNPIIIADLLKTGRYDNLVSHFIHEQGLSDDDIAWRLTDQLVRDAQAVFQPVWDQARGDDGYASFELDPLLEDPDRNLPIAERTRRYIDLGLKWSAGHTNRMIKVPATEAGLPALEPLAAAGLNLNVTLIFSRRQYTIARDNIWRGAQRRRTGLDLFKSVYSIFISRIDVYTEKQIPDLSPQAQGTVGILNAKEIWLMNQTFWKDKYTPLRQEIVFASTGTKKTTESPDKYVEALAGSDIQTNPPATNDAVEQMHKTYIRTIDQLPPQPVIAEIHQKVDDATMEQTLIDEGITKFADPQKTLLKLISEKRAALVR